MMDCDGGFVMVFVICVDKRMDNPETFYWNRPYVSCNNCNKHGNGSW